MKKLILFLGLLSGGVANAIPVVNGNVSNSGIITIYKDHKDPHRYYVAPNIVMLSRNNEGIPLFSYGEYRKNIFDKVGVMNMILAPAYTRQELEEAKAQKLKEDPEAQFSGLPFIESSLVLTGTLPELIQVNRCNHKAGLVGQEQGCNLVLSSKGRSMFFKALKNKTLFMTMQFEYKVMGVVELADGSYKDQEINHGVGVRIDGEQLAKYPQLINPL